MIHDADVMIQIQIQIQDGLRRQDGFRRFGSTLSLSFSPAKQADLFILYVRPSNVLARFSATITKINSHLCTYENRETRHHLTQTKLFPSTPTMVI
jgi:hypothetical protein